MVLLRLIAFVGAMAICVVSSRPPDARFGHSSVLIAATGLDRLRKAELDVGATLNGRIDPAEPVRRLLTIKLLPVRTRRAIRL
jgi:hypothetical protein